MVDLSGFAALAYSTDPAHPDQIRRFVDNVALSGADVMGQEVFAQGWVLHFRSESYQYDERPQHQRWIPVLDSGVTPLEVFIDRSHENGMRFLAGVRINDDHGAPSQAARWIHDHPDLKLRELPPGRFNIPGNTLDFTFPEVRDYYFGVIEEIVTRFDVDGIELTFRSCNHFPYPRSISRERQPLMTELMKRVRGMMDEAGRARGKDLLLGVRVPQTLDECHDCGLDIPTWASEELISYVSPGDTMYSDFNAPYEDFYNLTAGGSCRLYPGIQPYACVSDRSSHPMKPENYRAVAKNMYGAGADGVSIFNFHMQWGGIKLDIANNYPQAMTYLRELRDPSSIDDGSRLYTFRPLYGELDKMFQTSLKELRDQDPGAEREEPGRDYAFGGPGMVATGAVKADRMVLKRSEPYERGRYRFRLCENLGEAAVAYLYFRASGLQPDERIEVDVNGTVIAEDAIQRIWHENGRPPGFGRELPPFTEGMFVLSPDVAVDGDNTLGVRLVSHAPGLAEEIVIDELDVAVVPPART